MSLYTLAADAVWWLHLGMVAFLLVGWATPPPWLSVYLWGCPVTIMGWYLLGGCWVTKLESWLRGVEPTGARCVDSTLRRCGVRLPLKVLDIFEYTLLIGTWCVGIWRWHGFR